MCRRCFRAKLGCYVPATEDMLPEDLEDLKEFWRGYEEWMDDYADYAYEASREESYDD